MPQEDLCWRQMQEEWLRFVHLDLGARTHLLLATHFQLPDILPLVASRQNFREYIQEKTGSAKGRELDLPETIGLRSTAMPKLLRPGRDLFIYEDFPENLEPAQSITVRRNPAFRSTSRLDFKDVMKFLDNLIQRQAEIHVKAERKKRRMKAHRIQESLKKDMQARFTASQMYERYGDRLTARISSGMQTTFYITTKSQSWSTGIANVGLVYCDSETDFIPENPLKRLKTTGLTPIGMEGRVIFYVKGQLDEFGETAQESTLQGNKSRNKT